MCLHFLTFMHFDSTDVNDSNLIDGSFLCVKKKKTVLIMKHLHPYLKQLPECAMDLPTVSGYIIYEAVNYFLHSCFMHGLTCRQIFT